MNLPHQFAFRQGAAHPPDQGRLAQCPRYSDARGLRLVPGHGRNVGTGDPASVSPGRSVTGARGSIPLTSCPPPPTEIYTYRPAGRVTIVNSAGAVAEPGDAEIVAVLGLQTLDMDDEAMATLDRELIRLAQASPGRLAHVAAHALSGEDGLLRVAAAFALGRAAEMAEPDLVAQIEATLVERAAFAHDELLINAVATALLHVWGRSDDETFAVEQRLATDDSPALRLAAAKSLALSTPEPLPGFLVPTVRRLSADAVPAVRSWAEHALSYLRE